MEKKTSQELLRREGHPSLLIAVGIVPPAESNLVALEGHESMIGDGNAMSVAGEIAQHMMGPAERRLSIDDPVLAEQGAQEGAEGFFVGERLESSGKGELALVKESF